MATGTLESFYPVMCYNGVLSSDFPSGAGKTTDSSFETSPQTYGHVTKAQLGKRLQSVSPRSTEYDVYVSKRERLQKMSVTPGPNLGLRKRIPKINCQVNKGKSLSLDNRTRIKNQETKFVQLKEKVRNELM